MQNMNLTTLLCYGSIALFVLVFSIPIFIFFFGIGKLTKKEYDDKQTKKEAYRQSIRDNGGLLELGKIVYAKVINRPSKQSQRNTPFTIDFEVEFSPENSPTFRIKFRDTIFPNGYKVELIPNELDAENYQMISEYGKKVLVMYDPKETSRAYIDTYDVDNYRPARTIWRF